MIFIVCGCVVGRDIAVGDYSLSQQLYMGWVSLSGQHIGLKQQQAQPNPNTHRRKAGQYMLSQTLAADEKYQSELE